MLKPGFCLAAEQRHHVAHGELACCCLAFDCRVGQFSFAFLEIQDSCFHCFLDGHFVDFDVKGLVQSVYPVYRLFFNKLRNHS